jgi:hypothetical protein
MVFTAYAVQVIRHPKIRGFMKVSSVVLFIPIVTVLAFRLTPSMATARQVTARHNPQSPSSAQTALDTVTRVRMQNVDFYVDPQIPLNIRRLNGTMRARNGGAVVFDDKNSFIIHLDDAEVGLTPPALSQLLNKYVFNYPGSPLKRIAVSISGHQIIQRGILHKVADLPFEITAGLSVTPDGRIRVHPTRTEILGLHVDQLMNGLGFSLEKIIDLKKAKGASVKGNDIFLDPAAILPPPTMEGVMNFVGVEGNYVVQRFGSPVTSIPVPDQTQRNYMFYKGGSIRFGRLVMTDAELQIVDLDPDDPLRFNLDRYLEQLVAGYSRTNASGGLEAFMRDIDKLGKETLEVRSVPKT